MEEIGHKIYHKMKVSRLVWRNEWLVKNGAGTILFDGTERECGDFLSSKRREAAQEQDYLDIEREGIQDEGYWAAVNGTEFDKEIYEK